MKDILESFLEIIAILIVLILVISFPVILIKFIMWLIAL